MVPYSNMYCWQVTNHVASKYVYSAENINETKTQAFETNYFKEFFVLLGTYSKGLKEGVMLKVREEEG